MRLLRLPWLKITGGGWRLFTWLAFSLCLLMLGSAVLGRDGFLSVWVNRERLAGLRADLGEMERANGRLRREVQSLREDMRAIERIAREELGLVKPGETVYEFTPAEER
ncbi:MAG: septum formation initiator family protein [Candidatus Tectomicrobia bacterium]|uniref:Septum formation initiator family protein n=1 Tax=Tectimicrobiota bacterium TaxID=2528274 RepID=A0A932HW99_UNCTE|nr:septum formation initiator family protein [Candidatus Tectomicrobia bacterium]